MDRQKRVMQGVVTSTKMSKTITVEVTRTVRHPKYHKFLKRNDQYHAHDEQERCQQGDVVTIVESRPFSKSKRWRLKEVVQAVEA
ncbi:MAG: 30S ribosomal protein S17 [Myxococcaceae bacterium]|nr:30S ribosomal protein S17 [Myxococcaceae bacterium]MBH2006963.1 30S ribosomal protein S17 [Myxococcaceae bacterium]